MILLIEDNFPIFSSLFIGLKQAYYLDHVQNFVNVYVIGNNISSVQKLFFSILYLCLTKGILNEMLDEIVRNLGGIVILICH